MSEPLFDQLSDLLAAERTAIQSGAYASLADLEREKARLIADYVVQAPDPDRDARLLQEAQRNAALFSAAMAGLAAAVTRLNELEDIGAGFTAYGSDGQSLRVSPEQGRFRHKL